MVMCLLKHYVIVFLPNVKSHSSTSQMVVVCLFIDRHLSNPLSVKASIGLLQLTGFQIDKVTNEHTNHFPGNRPARCRSCIIATG